MDHRVCVAQIGAAHGVRGEVRLWTFTEEPAAVADYGPLQTEDGSRSFEIEAMRAGKGHLVVRLRGITDRTTAEALTNVKLYVPRERLPATLDTETFYHADLIGLAAVTQDGTAIGKVVAVQNFGAGDLLEIQPPGGGTVILLPFSEAVVPIVDLAAGKVIVAPPTETE